MTQKPREQSEAAKSEGDASRLVDDKTSPQTKDTKKAKPSRITKKQLEKGLKKAQEQSEKYKTQLAYLQADHENYVKSMKRREETLRLQANRDLILSLLPVLDDLERAQIMVPQIESNKPFTDGLQMVVENLKTALMNAGVKPIISEGQSFDPLRHEAVVREESTKVPPNTVIEELRKGYLLKGVLLRPSMVKIAIAPTPNQEEGKNSQSKKE